MIFLIEYDRASGELVSKTLYAAEHRRSAEQARIELEVRLNAAGVDREVVLLEAEDEASLRTTHERYFKPVAELSIPTGRQ